MAGEVIPETRTSVENLERYVKAGEVKVSNLQAKVDCFESFKNKTEKKIKELETDWILRTRNASLSR